MFSRRQWRCSSGPSSFPPACDVRDHSSIGGWGVLTLALVSLSGDSRVSTFPNSHLAASLPKLGFATLALCWLYTGLRAFLAIRRRAIEDHRRWMVRNFALTFAAVMLRIYIPASILAGVDFAVAYPFIAWLCWVPNVVIAQRRFNSVTHQ